MKKKKSNKILTFTIVVAILALLFVGFLEFKDEIKEKIDEIKINKNKENTNFNEQDEIFKLTPKLDDIYSQLGWTAIITSFENYNAGGNYEVTKNKNLIEKEEDKQLLVMEYILSNKDNNSNFIIVGQDGTKINDTVIYPNDNTISAYYPYDLFNKEYKKLFSKSFNQNKRKISTDNNAYDKNSKYVYYHNKRGGLNGQYVEKMTIDKIEYDYVNNNYKSTLNIKYSQRQIDQSKVTNDQATLTYKWNNNNIDLISFVIN